MSYLSKLWKLVDDFISHQSKIANGYAKGNRFYAIITIIVCVTMMVAVWAIFIFCIATALVLSLSFLAYYISPWLVVLPVVFIVLRSVYLYVEEKKKPRE